MRRNGVPVHPSLGREASQHEQDERALQDVVLRNAHSSWILYLTSYVRRGRRDLVGRVVPRGERSPPRGAEKAAPLQRERLGKSVATSRQVARNAHSPEL